MDERLATLGFALFPGIGPVRFNLLVAAFGNASDAFTASAQALAGTGLPWPLVERFVLFRDAFDGMRTSREYASRGITVVLHGDESYPSLLGEITDPPVALFVRGDPEALSDIDLRGIAVVGTRKMTPYGEHVTRRFADGLAARGYVIVSGMAYGVDAVAHRTAIARQGRTVAVLGCGVDIIAPPSSDDIYRYCATAKGSAVVSEMPPGLRPAKGLFPARNRLVSGLVRKVLVTEGLETSGSMITARYAAAQGRDVFAVPGSVTNIMSKGPHLLIRSGAGLATDVEDLIGDQPAVEGKDDPVADASMPSGSGYMELAQLLAVRPMTVDELVRETGASTADVMAGLGVLEMEGVAIRSGDGRYMLR